MPAEINNQHGAVLITALVILVLLTLLGLSAMSTTTLEERMAANSQAINRAFQAASSGLRLAYQDNDAFDINLTVENDGSTGDLYNKVSNQVGVPNNVSAISTNPYTAIAVYNSVFIQESEPKRGAGGQVWDKNLVSFYYFDLSAEGCIVATTSANNCNNAITRRVLHQGTFQVGNKSN